MSTHQGRDLSNWNPVDPLRLKDAAILWGGEDPSLPEDCTTRYRPTLAAMVGAIEQGALKVVHDPADSDIPESPEPEDWGRTWVTRNALRRWARSIGAMPAFLDNETCGVPDLPDVPDVDLDGAPIEPVTGTSNRPGTSNGQAAWLAGASPTGTDVEVSEPKRRKARSKAKDGLIDTEEAARILGFEKQTLEKWRSKREHSELEPIWIGRSVRYSEKTVRSLVDKFKNPE